MQTQAVAGRKPDPIDAELNRLAALHAVRGARNALEAYKAHIRAKVRRLEIEVEKAEDALKRLGAVAS